MTTPAETARARSPLPRLPLAYAAWQLRDTLVTRGVQALVIGLLLGAQVVLPLRLTLGAGWARLAGAEASLALVVSTLEGLLPPVLTLVAVHGLVSGDRRSGHFRLLFAKPVSVAGYYLQAWLALLLTLLLVGAVLAGAFAAVVRPVSPVPLLAMLALTYLLMGSAGFLLSALTRFDWLLLAAVWVGSGLAHSAWAAEGGWRQLVRLLLPPVHLLSPALERLRAGALPEGDALLRIVAYGTVCLVLALVVVRRRPLGA